MGEEHRYNPETIHLLQQSTREGSYELFKEYTKLVNGENNHGQIRTLLDFKYPKKGIPIEEVESVDSIVTRFKTGAMSYGSISQEAHETLAMAMNRIGGKSNSGEGGESLERLNPKPGRANRCSAINRWHQEGLESHPSIWSAPRRFRSRWRREQKWREP